MGICAAVNLPLQLQEDVKVGKITQDEANTIMAMAVGADDSGVSNGCLTVEEWEEYKKVTTVSQKQQNYMGGLFKCYIGNCGFVDLKKPEEK